mgnify:CR=1 FL=1|tara:strand:+ start:1032 stop:1280 length:249 start_codon:yes stop_codon:yes gene_type:complete
MRRLIARTVVILKIPFLISSVHVKSIIHALLKNMSSISEITMTKPPTTRQKKAYNAAENFACFQHADPLDLFVSHLVERGGA